jgi:uncharacterized protein YndB with AHSA1/START domain
MAEKSSADRAAQEFVFTRTYDAPRELVFEAWSKGEHMAQWWGPKGFAMKVAKLEFRAGGVFHYSMQPPKGPVMWGRFVYREVVAPERIVFVNSFSDEKGGIGPNPWIPDWPLEILNTLTLAEQDGKTTLTLRGGPIDATDEQWTLFVDKQSSMRQGMGGTFDQLADLLATM